MEATLIISSGILLGCILALSWFAGSDAPFVPTKLSRIRKILKLAGVKKGQEFWELGSGDGRVVLEATKMGAISYGVEQSLLRVLWSRWQAKKLNLSNAKFIHGDIFSSLRATKQHLRGEIGVLPLHTSEVNIGNADIIYIFLLPKGIEKLELILKRNLKKGARIITQTFHFEYWKPYKKVLITDENIPNTLLGKDKYEGEFWLYRV